MSIVVEDGSIVAGANSYVTVSDVRDFAVSRGVTLSDVDSDVEVLVFKAMDYIEGLRRRYKGTKTDATQPLQWPRTNVYIDGIILDSYSIPTELKNAQCQLCIEAFNGVSFFTTVTDPFVIKEKVGELEVGYSQTVNTSSQPFMPAVDSWLAPLFNFNGLIQRTVRI